MVDYLRRPVAHEAFFKKYASKKFLKGKLLGLWPIMHKNILMHCSFDLDSSMGEEECLYVPRHHPNIQSSELQELP